MNTQKEIVKTFVQTWIDVFGTDEEGDIRVGESLREQVAILHEKEPWVLPFLQRIDSDTLGELILGVHEAYQKFGEAKRMINEAFEA